MLRPLPTLVRGLRQRVAYVLRDDAPPIVPERHMAKLPWALLAFVVVASCWQAACDAERALIIQQQTAVVEAARHQGKTIDYRTYGPGIVKE